LLNCETFAFQSSLSGVSNRLMVAAYGRFSAASFCVPAAREIRIDLRNEPIARLKRWRK
jgi:hypothetical protein